MRVSSIETASAPAGGSSTDDGRGVAATERLDGFGDDRKQIGVGRADRQQARSARVRSIRSSTSRDSRRTCARANAMSGGWIGWPASSWRSASCNVIASGPSAFLISCAAAPNTAAGSSS